MKKDVRVLFVNMPIRATAPPNNLPLGPALMAANLETKGIETQILDLNLHRPQLTLEQLDEVVASLGQWDVVAFSGLITTYKWQKPLAKMFRKHMPDTYLVSGGGLATDLKDMLMDWAPEIDAVCTGEGDDEIFNIVEDARLGLGGQRPRKSYGGTIVRGLDDLPFPAWHLVDMETYLASPVWGKAAQNSSVTPFEMHRSANTVSSRGCPFACTFCDRNMTGGRNYRFRSAENVAEEVRLLIEKYDIDFMGFVDDNFMVSKKRIKALHPIFKAMNIKWGCHGRLDEADPETLELMSDAGCVYIGYGAESADPGTLLAMRKKITPDQMHRAIRDTKAAGIHPNCTWIAGYPGETREQLRNTAQFIMEHDLGNRNMFMATAYPGTDMFHVVKDKVLGNYDTFESYVHELDDATKFMVNFSAMDDSEFGEVRELIAAGHLDKV